MTSPDSHASLPALETQGFARGFLLTTRDALLTPARFYRQLTPGRLGLPFAFALLSLALPLISADIGAWVTGNATPSVPGVLRMLLAPLLVTALLLAIQAALWTAVSRLFGARAPINLALRAMAYLTSIASTFGVVMTLSGFAPESAFYVITWYLSLASAYLFATYASYRLARGAYALSPTKSALTVWLYQTACALTVIALMASYVASGGTLTEATKPTPEEPPTESQTEEPVNE